MVNKNQQDLPQIQEGDGRPPPSPSGPTMHYPASRTKKKVEWRSNLSSGEAAAPEDRSPNWDNETGHLLSYFLGDASSNQQEQTTNNISSPHTHFATTVSSASQASLSQRGPVHDMFRSRPNGVDYDEDEPVPPPTPAIQYYHHHSAKPREVKSTQRHRVNENGNPLMKTKVSFAADTNGGNSPHHPTAGAMSPVSPTSMIGPVQEPLMLPPSPKNGNNHHQTHLEWLQHINAVAEASKAAIPQHPPQQQHLMNMTSAIHQPVGVHPPHHPHHHPMTVGYPPIHGMPVPPTASVFYSQLSPKVQQQVAASSGVESEEKRAKRLERNRESARKSRRRKKERLTQLEEKVAELYSQIETERKKQIHSMDAAMTALKEQQVKQFQSGNMDGNIDELKRSLMNISQTTGPNCPVRRAVIEFQYSTLKQTIFPRYQKFLLWLTLHQEKYFITGKESHSRQDGKQLLRAPQGKLSSKQVGEDLTNGRKPDNRSASLANQSGDASNNQTAQAFDDTRMWPLLCFELSISVDQEERIMQAQKRVREDVANIQEKRSQIAAATRMALKLKEAMLYQSHVVEMRNKRTFIDILTPKQTLLYQQWLISNRSRCKDLLMKRKLATGNSSNSTESSSLLDVCKRLEEVLISQESKRD